MNHIYRSIWNDRTGTYVAAAETSKSGGKKASSSTGTLQAGQWALRALAASLCLACATGAAALPQGGVVTSGSANVTATPGNMTIVQGSQSAVLNWQSFGIGAGESVQFVQPGAGAVALNRVVGSDPSAILGKLSANGKVFLVNPNGILFGQGASVNVGGLVASTLGISDSDFMDGRYRFSGSSTQAVSNLGAINAPGGYVALLGAHVSNDGVIAARMGSVALAGGQAVTLDIAGDGLLNVTVNQGAVNALVRNGGLIQADGGQVLMTAQAAGKLLNTVVNNTGVIRAQTLVNHNGSIKLLGDMHTGTVNAGGTLDASAPAGGNGGFIETSAANVGMDTGLRITTAAANGATGKWLIDPTDFTVAPTGGSQTGAFYTDKLKTTDIEIATAATGTGQGNIHINDTISWSANKLTLTAHNDININAPLRGSGSASLLLQYGQANVASGNGAKYNVHAAIDLPAGEKFSTRLGNNGALTNYTVINSLGAAGSTSGTDLQGLGGALNGNYVLGANIDASATVSWNGGIGFEPIGSYSTAFSGQFDGLGHVISGMVIDRPGVSHNGLFGATASSAVVRNVGLEGGLVRGDNTSGALVGLNLGVVEGSYSTVNVTGGSQVGGLVGLNGFSGVAGVVRNSYASGNVSGNGIIGGLAGSNSGTLTNNYATGAVIGGHTSGGLVGASNGTASGNFWNTTTSGMASSATGTGLTTAQMKLMANYGGASWDLASTWIVYDSYTNPLLRAFMTPLQVTFTSNASKTYDGTNHWTAPSMTLSNPNAVLEGSLNYGAAGSAVNAGTYAITAGGLYSGQRGYAISSNAATLTIDRKVLTLTGATAANRSYDGSTAVAISGGALSGLVGTQTLGLSGLSGQLADKNVGTGKAVTVNGATLSDGGNGGRASNYTLDNLSGLTANVSKATISTVSNILVDSKVYDANTKASVSNAGATFGGMISGDALTVSAASATFNDKNAGSGKSVNASGLALGGSDAGNYNLTATAGSGTGTITPKALTITGMSAVSKVYDGNTKATLSGGAVSGLVGGETIGVTNLMGSFDTKDAGSAKTVTATGSTLINGGNGGLAANYTISNPTALTANITPKALTVSGMTAGTRSYDGTAGAILSGGSLAGLISGEMLVLAGGTGTFADKNVGNAKTVTVSGVSLGNGANGLASNYTLSNPSNVTGSITPKALTITGMSAVSKVYDGNTKASVTGGSIDGLVGAETLGVIGLTVSFDTKDAGNAKTVTATGTLLVNGGNGGLASNYTMSNPTGFTANITPKALTVSGMTAVTRVYDGSKDATLAGGSLSGLVSGESLVLAGGTGVFADKNAGNGKAVTVSGVSLGDGTNGLGSNYTVSNPTNVTGSITQKALTVSGTLLAADKDYDGLTDASISGGTLSGFVGSETVNLSGLSGAFADKNAGSAKAVTVTGGTLANGTNGGLASNYSVSASGNLTANIRQKTLTVTGATAANRSYDGSTAVAVSGGALSGLVGTETLGLSDLSGQFADKNAGIGKAVTVSGATLSDGGNGGLASNYKVDNPSGLTANVGKASIDTVSNILANSKVYDGSTKASVSNAGATFGGMISGDALTVSAASATFSDKNAGSGKSINASGLTLGGSDAGNYSLTATAGSGTGTITPKALTIIGMSAVSKVYDGNTKATLSGGSVSGLVGGETIGVTGLMASFDTKDAGSAKTVTATGSTLINGGNGGLAANYTISNPTALTANITPKALTVSGMTAGSKVYDGLLDAILSGGALSGLVAGETLLLTGGTGVFSDKNAGTGKAVTVSGVGIADGTGLASNYTVTKPTNVTGSITQKALTVTGALAADKTYDGTLDATITGGTLSGLVGSETVDLASLAGAFADKNAGSGKAVSVTGGTLSNGSNGGLASNYTVDPVSGLTASIAQKVLTVTGVTAAHKTYDGNDNASLSGGTLSGLVGLETLDLSGQSGVFSDKNAGSGKTVTISGATLSDAGSGATAGLASNYTVSNATGVKADIAQKGLTVAGITAGNKVYDGSTAASLNTAGASFNGIVLADQLTASASGAFTDKNAATGKDVAITGIALGGADAGNYRLSSTTATAKADIAQKALTVSGITAGNKVYDGSTAASLNTAGASFNGIVLTDQLTASASGAFADKNAATGKEVAITGIALGGADAGNYQLTSTTATAKADIAQKQLTLTGQIAGNKVYDGNSVASVTGGSLNGLVGGETLGVGGQMATFNDKNAANAKPVTVTGTTLLDTASGLASNYTVSNPSGLTASITPKALNIAGMTAAHKVFDGTPVASLSGGTLTGLVGNETLGLSGASGRFDSASVGSGKAVMVSGSTLTDGSGLASNYSVSNPTGLTADITAGASAADQPTAGSASASVGVGNAPLADTGNGRDVLETLELASDDSGAPMLQTGASVPFHLAALRFSITNHGIRLPPGVEPANKDGN